VVMVVGEMCLRPYLCCGVRGGAIQSLDCAAHAELRHCVWFVALRRCVCCGGGEVVASGIEVASK
jgi:hypothetical protein